MKKFKLLFCLWFISLSLNAQDFPFQNANLPFSERIDNLISLLTLEEKASLMIHNSPAIERLGIPEYNWWNECLHGIARAGKATVFPQAIGMAASFDEDLIFRIATAISDEARAKHNLAIKKGSRLQYTGLSFWSPNVNIFRDPRWGRGQETYGEDPFLTGIMGAAFVKGLQGDDPKYLKASACAKHFVVHSGPESSRHYFNALPGESDFRNTYLPAFKTLVNAGVESIMCAYNRIYDEACCASPFLLNDILRDEWGFKGHIVTDCWALDDIWARHKLVDTEVKAAALASEAGVNLNCGYVYSYLPEAVAKGLTNEKMVDANLAKLLETRFELGLFDPYEMNPYNNISEDIVNCEAHKTLAYEAAVKSIVLLKNDNNILPLNKDKIKKLFVTGPTAFNPDALVGNYNGYSGEMYTFLEGIIDRIDAGTVAYYSRGCLLNTDSVFHGHYQAGLADATIAVIGNTRMLEGEEGDAMLSKSGDREDIRLPNSQIELIRKLRVNAGGRPLIVVLTGGSAIAIPEIAELADAVLMAWYPGEQGGNALADILFGTANPSGKLPVTFYKSVEDLPDFDNYSMENRTYRYFKGEAQFEFGFGLSYTDFSFSDLKIEQKQLHKSDTLIVNFKIKNTALFSGEEVIQAYIRYPQNEFYNPNKDLKCFERIYLNSGEEKVIELKITLDKFEFWDKNIGKYLLKNGEYILEIGSSSKNIFLSDTIFIKTIN